MTEEEASLDAQHPIETIYPSNTGEPTADPTLITNTSPSLAPSQMSSLFPTNQPTFYLTVQPTSLPTIARVEPGSPMNSATDASITTFYAIADAPYNALEAEELPKQIWALPSAAEFLIHLGDIRTASSGDSCELHEYNDVAAILQRSAAPVFMVVGGKNMVDMNSLKLSGRN
jgi:hypothetical protein